MWIVLVVGCVVVVREVPAVVVNGRRVGSIADSAGGDRRVDAMLRFHWSHHRVARGLHLARGVGHAPR